MSNPEAVTEIGDIPLEYSHPFTPANICYIILTCEKYIPTRVAWQKATCFRNTNLADCYFLSCKPSAGSVYGWNTADDYPSCIVKYIKFFQNMDLNYDWYMFIDDDTFVFPKRAEQYVNQLDHTTPSYVGSMWSHIPNLRFASGGAGFFLSRPAYKMLRTFLMNDVNAAMRTREAPDNGDATLGVWINEINRRKGRPIQLFNDWIHIQAWPTTNLTKILSCVTFHYVGKKEQFDLYNKYLNITDMSLATPTKCVGLPTAGSNVTIAHADHHNYALRHAYFKISIHMRENDNDDFTFIVRTTPTGVAFESTNHPGHYLMPTEGGVYIHKGNRDAQSWRIDTDDSGNMALVSLSPNWQGKCISVGPFSDNVNMSSDLCHSFALLVWPTA